MFDSTPTIHDKLRKVYAVADSYLPQSISSIASAEARDELHGELTYGIYALLEEYCEEVITITTERSGIFFSDTHERIARVALWNDVLLSALDSVKTCHLDFIAKKNPDAAADLEAAIYEGLADDDSSETEEEE